MPYLRTRPAHARSAPSLAERYRALRVTHAGLDEELAAEMKRPLPDGTLVQRAKRRKLLVKDELAAIERLLAAIGTSVDDALLRAETRQRETGGQRPKRRAAIRDPRPVAAAAAPVA